MITDMKTAPDAHRMLQRLEELGINQARLAKEVGVSEETISRIALRKTKRTGYTLAIAKALKVTPEWLIGMSHRKLPPKVKEVPNGLEEWLSKFNGPSRKDEADILHVLAELMDSDDIDVNQKLAYSRVLVNESLHQITA